MKQQNTRMIAMMGLLIALQVVLSRFLSINLWNIKIGFSFVPIVLCGMWYGAIPAGVMAVLSDVLGAILFPSGMFFPGFTVTALLRGLSCGVMLHKEQTVPRILSLVLFHQIVLGLWMNTFWLSILYDSPYVPLMSTRWIQYIIIGPVEFVVTIMMTRFGKRVLQWS